MKYKTLVIDPPWPIKMASPNRDRPNRAKELPYITMSLEEIGRFKIDEWAEEGAHIYLWTTNRLLLEAFGILEKWNVRYYMTFTWTKPSGILCEKGWASCTEFCLIGFYKGVKIPFKDEGESNWMKAFNKPGEHSKKPWEFYAKVERMSPAPRVDVFARRVRKNWDVWGNEVEGINKEF